MTYREQAIVFPCERETLVGILTLPAGHATPSEVGLVVIVGGPQYRVGSHRQFLDLSRRVAAAGISVLRFDVRGMGDSTGDQHTFETITPDIAAAIDALQRHVPNVSRVALWGLCDGASAALLYLGAQQDVRVRGICLLNPWVRSEVSLARAHVKHYYWDRLRQRSFWVKLFSGKVAVSALAGLWRNIRLTSGGGSNAAPESDTPFQERMAVAWRTSEQAILLVLSGNDYTAREFLEYAGTAPAWRGALTMRTCARHDVAGADHTFASKDLRSTVSTLTIEWLRALP